MTRRPRTRVDWRRYFRDFCEIHGQGYPPLTRPDGTRLLFPDGWSYATDSHRGPEWPPPDDRKEFHEAVRTYWRLYRLAVRRALVVAREELAAVRIAVQRRSAPLTVRVTTVDPDSGVAETNRQPLRVEDYEARVAELEQDLALSERNVTEQETELKLLRMSTPAADRQPQAQGAPR